MFYVVICVLTLCSLVGDYQCYAGTSVSSCNYVGNCERNCTISKIFILASMKASKCHFLQCMLNISFPSHQIVLSGINTSDDSDGRDEKDLINLTNQFTNLEMIVIRNVTPCSLLDGYLSVIFMFIAVRPYSTKFSFSDF
jgi:hypothetical protein